MDLPAVPLITEAIKDLKLPKITFKPLMTGTPSTSQGGPPIVTPAAPLPGVADLEDSVTLHPETDEEAALEAEADELQRIHDAEVRAEQERQARKRKVEEAKAASASRCAALRLKIQGLQGRITDIHSRRQADAPIEEGYPAQDRRVVRAAPAAALGAPREPNWAHGVPRAPLPPPIAVGDQRLNDSDIDMDEYMVHGKYQPSLTPRVARSGLVARSTDQVRFPQTWPHVALQDEFFQQSLEFKDLDFRLFVAGELEIATSPDISDRERTGRLMLLKQLAYLNGAHHWNILKNIYLTVVRKIELGSLDWGSSFLSEIQWILTKHTVTQPARSQPPTRNTNYTVQNTGYTGQKTRDTESRLMCFDYNKGACAFREAHYINTKNGRQEWVRHGCSKCWRKDTVYREHPRTDCTQ